MYVCRIPPYVSSKQPNRDKNLKKFIQGELQRKERQLKDKKEKIRKLRKKCKNQKVRLLQAEQQLERERKDTAWRELSVTLQNKLDDLAFYRSRSKEGV